MLKKMKISIMCMVLVAIVSGCSSSISKDTIDYSSFSALVSGPTSSTYFDNGANVKFTAMIISDKEEMTVDEENKNYVVAMIARNSYKPIYLDITEIEYSNKIGDVVTVDGNIDGYLYWISNGAEEEVLNIKTNSIKIKEADNDVTVSKDIYINEEKQVTIDFKEAVKDTNSFDTQIAYVYYNLENKNNQMFAQGNLNFYFYAYQNDEMINTTIFNGNLEQPSNALIAGHVDAGKKVYMYQAYELRSNDPITIYAYDDNFNAVFIKAIEIK